MFGLRLSEIRLLNTLDDIYIVCVHWDRFLNEGLSDQLEGHGRLHGHKPHHPTWLKFHVIL